MTDLVRKRYCSKAEALHLKPKRLLKPLDNQFSRVFLLLLTSVLPLNPKHLHQFMALDTTALQHTEKLVMQTLDL